ncbi:MAG: lysylphosphatidylglycerol synthase transmembrane domain-containing protein [Candidatus Pacebacteria bacterium]|nr:lysylphosphatidylglycerol synthase transmembrane domain-containing protein [Candidatus Paceibacterota bacterium]
MKKIGSIIVSFLIGFFVFFFIIKWTGWQEIRNAFNLFLSYKGLLIVLLSILIWIIGALKWKLILQDQGYHFPFLKLLEIYFAGSSLTYLTPIAIIGGEGFRAYALKNKFSIPWQKNIAVLAIEKILSVFSLAIFLLFGIVSFFFLTSWYLKYLEILIIGFFLLVIFILFFIHFKLYKKENLIKFILRILGVKNNGMAYNFSQDVFSFFHFKKPLFLKTCLVAFLKYAAIFLRVWLLLFFLVQNQNILIAGSIMLFIYISYLIPVPAAIGSLEAAQTFAFDYLGFEAIQGITFSIVLRSAELFVVIFGIIFLLKLGIFLFFDRIRSGFNNHEKKITGQN